jgi:hypothetical protein
MTQRPSEMAAFFRIANLENQFHGYRITAHHSR